MSGDIVLLMAAIAAIGSGVLLGPTVLNVRAILRLFCAPVAIRRWQGPVSLGLGAGLVGATAVCGVVFGGPAAALAATLGLLLLLAVMDLAWRWLPFAWTVPILALGVVSAWVSGTVASAGWGLVVGAGTLLALQLGFRLLRGVTALGGGDIWLAAGLGLLVGPQQITWVLGLAAATGLLAAGMQRIWQGETGMQRMGVAYGTHLCVAYAMILLF